MLVIMYYNMPSFIGYVNNAMIKIPDIFYSAPAYCRKNYGHNFKVISSIGARPWCILIWPFLFVFVQYSRCPGKYLNITINRH